MEIFNCSSLLFRNGEIRELTLRDRQERRPGHRWWVWSFGGRSRRARGARAAAAAGPPSRRWQLSATFRHMPHEPQSFSTLHTTLSWRESAVYDRCWRVRLTEHRSACHSGRGLRGTVPARGARAPAYPPPSSTSTAHPHPGPHSQVRHSTTWLWKNSHID